MLRLVTWQDDFLAALAGGASTWAEAARVAGVPFNTARSELRRKRGSHWESTARKLKAKNASAVLATRSGMGAVPGFLEWREAHCAYIDPRSSTVKRARNSWFQIDAAARLEEHNRIIIVLPPGHIKTTFFAIEMSSQAIMNDRNIRILNIQKNEQEAAKVISAVQERLTDREYYANLARRLLEQGEDPISDPIAAYGGKLGYKPQSYRTGEAWGRFAFRVPGVTSGEKDFTMQAKGVGSQIQGIRADRIILDDIQDPSRVSPHDTQEKLDWFHTVILGRVYDWQQVVVLGNRLGPGDFMGELIKAHPDWPVVYYPAILDAETDPKPLCPEVWSLEGLAMKEGEVGPTVWAFMWMQEEIDPEGSIFTRDQIEANRSYDFLLRQKPPGVTDIVIGVDPAVVGYCAMVVVGVDRNSGRRYLIDVVNEKAMKSVQRIIDRIIELCDTYHPRVVVIEQNNVQRVFSNDERLRKELASLGVRIDTYQTVTETGARREGDDFNVSNVGALFTERLFTLPFGDEETRAVVRAYIDQLVSYRPGVKHLTRDMVMATLFAESQLREFVRQARRPAERKLPLGVPSWATNGEGRWAWTPKLKPKRRGFRTPSDDELIKMRE